MEDFLHYAAAKSLAESYPVSSSDGADGVLTSIESGIEVSSVLTASIITLIDTFCFIEGAPSRMWISTSSQCGQSIIK